MVRYNAAMQHGTLNNAFVLVSVAVNPITSFHLELSDCKKAALNF